MSCIKKKAGLIIVKVLNTELKGKELMNVYKKGIIK